MSLNQFSDHLLSLLLAIVPDMEEARRKATLKAQLLSTSPQPTWDGISPPPAYPPGNGPSGGWGPDQLN